MVGLLNSTILFELFLLCASVCIFQFNWLSRMTPSDFLVITRLIVSPKLISRLSSRLSSRYLEPIIINSVLLFFNVSLFAESHLSILTRSVLGFSRG